MNLPSLTHRLQLPEALLPRQPAHTPRGPASMSPPDKPPLQGPTSAQPERQEDKPWRNPPPLPKELPPEDRAPRAKPASVPPPANETATALASVTPISRPPSVPPPPSLPRSEWPWRMLTRGERDKLIKQGLALVLSTDRKQKEVAAELKIPAHVLSVAVNRHGLSRRASPNTKRPNTKSHRVGRKQAQLTWSRKSKFTEADRKRIARESLKEPDSVVAKRYGTTTTSISNWRARFELGHKSEAVVASARSYGAKMKAKKRAKADKAALTNGAATANGATLHSAPSEPASSARALASARRAPPSASVGGPATFDSVRAQIDSANAQLQGALAALKIMQESWRRIMGGM